MLHERSLKKSLHPAGTAAAAPPPDTSEPAVPSSSTQEQPSRAEETQKPAEAEEQSEAKEETESQPEAKKEEIAAAKYSEATKPLAEMPSTAAAAPVPEAVKDEEEEGTTDRYKCSPKFSKALCLLPANETHKSVSLLIIQGQCMK